MQKMVCEENIPGRYRLDIIDICERPVLAGENQIVAAPTLVKESPTKKAGRKYVGYRARADRPWTALQDRLRAVPKSR